MTGTTFGRKGLADGTAAAPSRRATFGAAAVPALVPAGAEDPYADLRASFLASERSRRGETGDTGSQMSAALRLQATQRVELLPKEPPFPGQKKIHVAYALWFILGAMSGHRLYLGRPLSALGQWALWYVSFFLYMAGHTMAAAPMVAGLLWLLADGYRLPAMLRATNDKLRSRLQIAKDVAPA